MAFWSHPSVEDPIIAVVSVNVKIHFSPAFNEAYPWLNITNSELSLRDVVAGTHNQLQAGIGIFDGEALESVCVGSNLDASQLDNITGADPSRFW